MKRNIYSLVLFFVFFFGWIQVNAQTVDTSTDIFWVFDNGTTSQVATYTSGTEGYFNPDYFTVGSNLKLLDSYTTYGVKFTRFQPLTQASSATDDNAVIFGIRPKTGIKFKPTHLSFDCSRYGTDGGNIDVVWVAPDATTTSLQTGIRPNRNNSGSNSHIDIDISSLNIAAAEGEAKLKVIIYNLGNTKQIGIANIKISGQITGTLASVTTYTLTTSVMPSSAGNITSNPVGNTFDAGTSITLSAKKNFGYTFSHWEDDQNTIVSTSADYTFTLNSNVSLKAVFTPVDTYSLQYNVEGGAKPYMIALSPAPTIVNGLSMYESGTNVTLTASNNDILTFTNWENGETNAVRTVTMNENKNLIATYSCIDYIAAWDFYQPGSGGRVADFASNVDNESSALILRKTDGTTTGWLDKSQVAAGGYEGHPAAVNWQPIADKYYYQISVNAADFTNISVKSSMLYNYNAYSVQQIEYSLDGTNFVLLNTIQMTSPKVWYPMTVNLPSDADHAQKLYIRWIPDYTSPIVGTSSNNDGTAISGIYVFGKKEIISETNPPVLLSSIPAENGTNASTTGKIVLNFDEKVQVADGVTASIGSRILTPAVSGKTITFSYSGLDYNSAYTFTLLGNTVMDLLGNVKTDPIVIHFNTMSRPVVTKKTFDFVVGVDGDFKAALTAAQNASSSGSRFYIFFPNGQYDIGSNTGDANQMTTINVPNLSLIGQSADNVIVYNKSIQESINTTATMYFTSSSSNNYLQDLSLMNKMDYRTGTLVGRGVALWDQGNKNIYKRVKLLSNQDTYYSGGSIRSYFENSEIHGTVDFICGGGDIFFNECLLYLEDRSGNCITAPATSTQWGYVFNNCTIDGFPSNNTSYRLGRPWSNAPKAVYLNTKMAVLPVSAGWGDPMNVVPAVFAEFNSMTANGAAVDLTGRRTTYTKDATTVVLNPVLTADQAATYTIDNVLSGSDAWQPKLYTDQAAAPVISGNGRTITWENNDYVLCWGIFKDDQFVQFVTANSYAIPVDVNSGVYSVRAANEMGGLSPVSNTYQFTNTSTFTNDFISHKEIQSQEFYTVDGKKMGKPNEHSGILLKRTIYSDGSMKTEKILMQKGLENK